MRITKFGHCCLMIEENGLRILTDPGIFTDQQDGVRNIDLILITHEHADHCHVESVKNVLSNNPEARIITNTSVGRMLNKESIPFQVLEDGQEVTEQGVRIRGVGSDHAVIHSSIPIVQNTGYFIGNRLFYPGDAFTHPGREVDILALPVAGPWMKLSEAIDYARALKPKQCFPVHDGVVSAQALSIFHRLPAGILEKQGIEFIALELGREYQL